MAVPGRVDAAALLLSLHPPGWFLRHSRAVAEVAAWLARRLALRVVTLDRRLVESAALLHDVDKLLPPDDPAGRRPHGAGSAAWLARQGHAELGPAVAAHPVTRLLRGDPAGAESEAWSIEERVVAYADKRAGQRLEPMASRFAEWRRRYPPGPGPANPTSNIWTEADLGRAVERAERLEAEVCAAADIHPDEVRRLAWTGRALRAAARAARRSTAA